MIVNKLCISISILATLCIITKNRLIDAQYNGGGYELANHYGGGHASGYDGYAGHNGYGGDVKSMEEVDERPKVQLGVRLKIPAFKFELPRMNLPKITISAKIRQPEGPRVITLPEINLDTSSKVSPPGTQPAKGQSGHYMSENSNYEAQKQPYYSSENEQTFSFSTQGDESPKPIRPSPVNYANKYRFGSNYGGRSYSSSNNQPSYFMSSQNQYNLQNHNNYNNKRKMITNESYRTYANNPDIGFNTPVYLEPGLAQASHSVNSLAKPVNHPMNYHRYPQPGTLERFHGNQIAAIRP